MTYQDLPQNWPNLSLRDADHGADLVDLLLSNDDRKHNSFLLLPCQPDGVPIGSPIVIGFVDWCDDPAPLFEMWSLVSGNSAKELPIVIATSHPGKGQPALHRDWLARASKEFTNVGSPVLASFTAARDGVHG